MICVMGDTHGDYSRFSHRSVKQLKKGDFLIICGDFGFVWDGSDREKAMLKKIGSTARYEIEQLLECRVNLKLWVKVQKNWRDSDYLMKNFGYHEEEY